MDNNATTCSVCDLRHLTTPSTHWCVQCEQALCFDCKDYHNLLKATTNHKTIDISEYKSLPTFVTDIQQFCLYHKDKFRLYCVKHELPICTKCLKQHMKCYEVLPLEELIMDVKTSDEFVDLEKSLTDTLDNFKVVREDRESNITHIKDQRKAITEEHGNLKNQVIQYINKLEEEFIKELDKVELNYCDSIRSIVSVIRDKEKEINQMRTEIQNMKSYASDLQTFLCIKEFQTRVREIENFLRSLVADKSTENISIHSTLNVDIQGIMDVKQIGSISIENSSHANIDLYRSIDKQAQIMISKTITSVNNIKLDFERTLDTAFKLLCGSVVTTKGEYLFSNYDKNNEKLIAMKSDGEVEFTLPMTDNNSFDIVCLDDTTVAVSTGYSNKKSGISIIDLQNLKVTKFINLSTYPYGITYDGTSLICCVEDNDIHVISCTDYSITTIPNTVLPELSYVATYANKIFFTNSTKHTVTCCLFNGTPVWEFTNEGILNDPRGITLDNNGNVFVAGCYSCNVVVISADGKQYKEVLSKKNGLKYPRTIFFDKLRRQLLVADSIKLAYVFNISDF